MKRLSVIALCLSASMFCESLQAKMMARPESMGGDYLLEIVTGVAFEEHEDIFELGIDLEYFVKGTEHHLSLGLATELDFTDHGEVYYFGPLVSGYYKHFKLYFTSGLLTDFEKTNHWKSRLGLGYEFVIIPECLVIPSVAVDYIQDHFSLAITLGIAHEF